MQTLDFKLDNGILKRTDTIKVLRNTKNYYRLCFDLKEVTDIKAVAVHFESLTKDEYTPLIQKGGKFYAMLNDEFSICSNVDISVVIKTKQSEYKTNKVTVQQR